MDGLTRGTCILKIVTTNTQHVITLLHLPFCQEGVLHELIQR